MKQFFKFMFASLLGSILAMMLVFLIFLGMLSSLASLGKKDTTQIANNSVLHLQFNTEVVDRGGQDPFDSFDFLSMSTTRRMGLNDLLSTLKKAAGDDKIKGILLDLGMINAGYATIGEIREALVEFKESGKFIISYGEMYSQKAYYLASVSDQILLHPEGMIAFLGINSETVFLKNMLDKLGIDPQIIRHGKYKSAGEPFFLDRMSPESKEQVSAYIGSIWNNVIADIGKSRNMTVNELNDIANGAKTRNASTSMEAGMIDGIKHRDELKAMINELMGEKPDKDIPMVGFPRYQNAPMPKNMVQPRSRNKVAVIYASGSIMDGAGSENIIGSAGMSKAIREARRDSTVKAIVLRVNSPGGSAMASDVILREARLAADTKPLIVSMGDVAASGGYYISCAAHSIIANPTTLTGSIGVFGMVPNMQGFFNDKLGITFDNVKTNDLADLGSLTRPLNRAERALIQEQIEQVYDTFTAHVATGRNMTVDMVDELGQGRVWSGSDARQNGLIDEFGGLAYAIKKAAEMAEVDNYRVVEYPSRKDFLTRLMEDFGGIRERRIEKKLGSAYIIYRQIEEARRHTGIQARLPFDILID